MSYCKSEGALLFGIPFYRPIFFGVAIILSTCMYTQAQSGRTQSPHVRAAAASGGSAHENPYTGTTRRDIDLQARDILGQMTLSEKVGQLVEYAAGSATGPGKRQDDLEQRIARGEVGSLINLAGAEETNRYQRIAVEKSRLHIPLLFGFDVIHGDRTIFPVPIGLAASFDSALVEETAHAAAVESRMDGVRWVFSPMVDIARDARWGRIVETSGEDPFLSQNFARAYVRGYQHGGVRDPDSVAACVKHFAGYGAATGGRDYNAVDSSELTLRDVYLPPYRAAIDAGAGTVMSAFSSVNGVPAAANAFLLTEVLRKEWGFNGFVVSDWGAVRELLDHRVAADGYAAARMALSAGLDVDMEGDIYDTYLADLVKRREIPESLIDDAVLRVLRVKLAIGLFESPYAQEGNPYVLSPERRALARRAAESSFVLLKNNALPSGRPILPLAHPGTIALIGPFAESKSMMLGSWPANGNANDVTTLREALLARMEKTGGKLIYEKGTDISGDSSAGIAMAVKAASNSDVVLLTLGEDGATMTGEATSRAHLDLPGNQQQLLEAIASAGKPIVLVLFSGRPLAIPWAGSHVPAILEAWFPGIEAGPALADVLFGDVSPSGKLPVSFPRSVGQEPLSYMQFPTGRPSINTDLSHPPRTGPEKDVSRYIDEENAPLFPFGWGLTYTEFSFSRPLPNRTLLPLSDLKAGRALEDAPLKIGFDIRNDGGAVATETVQMYIGRVSSSVEQPIRELKGFARVTLAPGEQRHLELPLDFDELSFIDAKLERVVEPTSIDVWIGDSSLAEQHTSFLITQ
jgi:beta-glucosidase